MQLHKKGKADVSKTTIGILVAVITVVILFSAAPELWTVLDTAFTDISIADIPLVSGMTGVLGLVFGAVILLGGLFVLLKNLQTR